MDMNPPSIISSVSELAMDIAKTKLVPANVNGVTGKYNQFKSADSSFLLLFKANMHVTCCVSCGVH